MFPNFFHFTIIEATVLQGTIRALLATLAMIDGLSQFYYRRSTEI